MANDNAQATLIDTNVILDIVTEDETWANWSEEQLARAADLGDIIINPIIYAEVSVGFERIEELDTALPVTAFRREALPYAAGFLAGKAFLTYRSRGGTKATTLPDFYIGAHAAVSGHRLLTRDRARYATYFPKLDLITPER